MNTIKIKDLKQICDDFVDTIGDRHKLDNNAIILSIYDMGLKNVLQKNSEQKELGNTYLNIARAMKEADSIYREGTNMETHMFG